MLNIKVKECDNPRTAADLKDGEFTDRIFYMRHIEFGDWYMESVIPRDKLPEYPIPSPACLGIAVKECIKVCLCNGAPVALYTDMHFERLNRAAQRYRLPTLEKEMLISGLRTLIEAEQAFLTEDNCLYAHIVLYASESRAPKSVVRGAVVTISLEFEKKSAPKAITVISDICPLEAGRYSLGAMFDTAEELAHFDAVDKDCDSVLWLDNFYNKYILGLAGMNIFVRTKDCVITPSDTFMGIMYTTALSLMNEWSVEVKNCKLTVDELLKMYKNGEIIEVFATSTRAGILPVKEIRLSDETLKLDSGKLTKKLADTLSNIECGIHPPLKNMLEKL